MITLSNYAEKTEGIDFAKLPEVIREGHEFVLGNSDLYDKDEDIKEVIDSQIKFLNERLGEKTSNHSEAGKIISKLESLTRTPEKLKGNIVEADNLLNDLFQIVKEEPKYFEDLIRFNLLFPRNKRFIMEDIISEIPFKENAWKIFEYYTPELKTPKRIPEIKDIKDKSLFTIVKSFISNDELRPAMTSINVSSKGIAATDGHRLIFLNKRFSKGQYGNYCLTAKCFKNEKEIKTERFPDYSSVIPPVKLSVDIDLSILYHYAQVHNYTSLNAAKKFITFKIKDNFFALNGEFVSDAAISLFKLGYESITLGFSATNRGVLISGKGKLKEAIKFNADLVLIMPQMLLPGDGKEELKNKFPHRFYLDLDDLNVYQLGVPGKYSLAEANAQHNDSDSWENYINSNSDKIISEFIKKYKLKIPKNLKGEALHDHIETMYDQLWGEYVIELESEFNRKSKITTKGKKVIKSNSVKAHTNESVEMVEKISPEVSLLRRLISLLNKDVQKEKILLVVNAMQKALVEKLITKKSTHGKLIVEIEGKLRKLLSGKDKILRLEVGGKKLNDWVAIAGGEKVYPSVGIIKAYISIQGKKVDQNKVDALRKRIDKAKISEDDPYYNKIIEIEKALFLFKKSQGLKISKQELNGLTGIINSCGCKEVSELNGVDAKEVSIPKTPTGKIFRADMIDQIDTPDSFRLPGEEGKLIGRIQPYQWTMTLTGKKGAGKNTFAIRVANGFLSLGKKVDWFDLEQGGLMSEDTRDLITKNIDEENKSGLNVYGEEDENGLDTTDLKTIEMHCKPDKLIVVDSLHKVKKNTVKEMVDYMRKKFPTTYFIWIIPVTSAGTAKGGPSSEHDATIVLYAEKPDHTFKNNYIYPDKNRGNRTDLRYMLYERKTITEDEAEERNSKKSKS